MRSENEVSWTDELPHCNLTGCGELTNQVYREDGAKQEGYKSRDRKCYCKIDDEIFLYALFSGNAQNSQRVTELALQTMAASILLGQVNAEVSEAQIINIVKQSFHQVEKEYNDSIGHLLARKAVLLESIPKDISQYEVTQRCKHILSEMIAIHDELSAGASCVLALIYKSKLYIGNIGASKALLCKNDDNNVLRVTQLSVDHDLSNPDEEQRIKSVGLDVKELKENPNFLTRCFGNYLGKAGFKDSTILSGAAEPPILSEPEIVGPITIDDSCRFLILMSKGLCQTLTDIFETDSSRINKEIVQMAVEQFRTQMSLHAVAQSVVNKISLMHHETFMQDEENRQRKFRSREDITLLIRNFNYPLPNAMQKRSSQSSRSASDTSSTVNTDASGTNTTTTSEYMENGRFFNPMQKIKPYVDFSDYFKRVEEAKKNGTLPPGINFD